MEASSTGSSRAIYQNISSSGVQTFSVYVKAGTTDWIRLNLSGIGNRYFDIGNGVVGGSGSMDGFITDVGDGWYRCSVLGNGSSSGPYIFLASDNGNLAVNVGDNIYIQSAQLESGLAATDVLTSGATTAKAGVLIDLPRINYDANGENGALLLEPSRQQLIQFSEYFGAWDKVPSAITITDNAAISPEGVQNAAYVQFTAESQYIKIDASGSSTTYTGSVWIKGTAGETIQLAVTGSDSGLKTLTGDWDRIEYTATGASLNLLIHTFGGATARNVYIFGAMLEAGSYVSSYIPNHSGTGGVTRAADSCSVTGASDVIGQTEGTLFLNISALYDDATNRRVTLSDGTATNRMYVSYKNYTNQIRVEVISAGSSVFDSTYSSSDITANSKIALAYKSNDFAFYVNGTQVSTDTSGAVPTSLTAFKFEDGSGGNTFFGNVKQATLFKERLTNAELATLTTL